MGFEKKIILYGIHEIICVFLSKAIVLFDNIYIGWVFSL